MWNSTQRESLTSVLQHFPSGINKAFVLTGRLDTGLSFYEVETLSWYILFLIDPQC